MRNKIIGSKLEVKHVVDWLKNYRCRTTKKKKKKVIGKFTPYYRKIKQ